MVNLVLGLYAEGSGPHVSGFQGFSSKSGCLRPLHSRLSTVTLETCSRGAASAWSALYARESSPRQRKTKQIWRSEKIWAFAWALSAESHVPQASRIGASKAYSCEQ